MNLNSWWNSFTRVNLIVVTASLQFKQIRESQLLSVVSSCLHYQVSKGAEMSYFEHSNKYNYIASMPPKINIYFPRLYLDICNKSWGRFVCLFVLLEVQFLLLYSWDWCWMHYVAQASLGLMLTLLLRLLISRIIDKLPYLAPLLILFRFQENKDQPESTVNWSSRPHSQVVLTL